MKRAVDTNNILEEIHDYCIDFSNRQVYLHDSVKEDCDDGIDFRVATRFIKNMAILSQSDEAIVVHLLSYGGQCDSGFAIYDCIKNSHCHISILCHGVCMSMGTVVTQAADERVAMPSCTFMFHEGYDCISGTHKQTQAWAEAAKKTRERMLEIYAERCQYGAAFQGKSLLQVKNYLQKTLDKKEDWVLDASEALHFGFIDRILTEKEFKSFVQRT